MLIKLLRRRLERPNSPFSRVSPRQCNYCSPLSRSRVQARQKLGLEVIRESCERERDIIERCE